MFFSTINQANKKNNVALNLFITMFKSMTPAEKIQKIHELISQNKFDFIVTVARIELPFYETCSLTEFSDIWMSCWSTYGIVLTDNMDKALYVQPNIPNAFNLFLGMYFYQKALLISQKHNKKYTESELNCLNIAVEYQSIHACQRYHSYLYEQMDHDPLYKTQRSRFFREIIHQIKLLLPAYRSYAYLMLTEAYIRYAHFLQETATSRAEAAFNAAFKSCNHAIELFDKSKVSIFNASLGGTIANSNTFGLSNFDEIKTFIQTIRDTKRIPYENCNDATDYYSTRANGC